MLKQKLKDDVVPLKTVIDFTPDSTIKAVIELNARRVEIPEWIQATYIVTDANTTIDLFKSIHEVTRHDYQVYAGQFWQDPKNYGQVLVPSSEAYAKSNFATVLKKSLSAEARQRVDCQFSYSPTLGNDGTLIWLFIVQTVFPNSLFFAGYHRQARGRFKIKRCPK